MVISCHVAPQSRLQFLRAPMGAATELSFRQCGEPYEVPNLRMRKMTNSAVRTLLLILLTAIVAQGQTTDLQWFHLSAQGVQPSPRADASIIEGFSRTLLLFGGLAGTP